MSIAFSNFGLTGSKILFYTSLNYDFEKLHILNGFSAILLSDETKFLFNLVDKVFLNYHPSDKYWIFSMAYSTMFGLRKELDVDLRRQYFLSSICRERWKCMIETRTTLRKFLIDSFKMWDVFIIFEIQLLRILYFTFPELVSFFVM